MAASQARLLSITARLTNNENTGQSISYSKQRLADQTQQITNEYNEALKTTKLTVLTGFNGAEATYTDISYNVMTSLQMAENTKQYIVTDTKGRILVSEDIADAYKASNGNYNQFLAKLGYSQSDITVQISSTDTEAKAETEQKIHEAWDAYFATVGINLGDDEHDFGFGWKETYVTGGDINNQNDYAIGQGYATYTKVQKDNNGNVVYNQATDEDGTPLYKMDSEGNYELDDAGNKIPIYDYSSPVYVQAKDEDGNLIFVDDGHGNRVPVYETEPINYEGTTQESRDLYDYAMAITEAYLRTNDGKAADDPTRFKLEYDMNSNFAINSAANSDNASALQYYKNIFTKMQSSGYFTYTNTPADAVNDPEHYIYASVGTGTAGNVQKSPLYDNVTFEGALRDGTLRLEYFSTTDKKFVSTTISEDTCIQEVADERAIAAAESKYNQDMTDLENKDKKLDLELKKLDTEHSALQTEYDSVKNIVDKNVESSFKIFS